MRSEESRPQDAVDDRYCGDLWEALGEATHREAGVVDRDMRRDTTGENMRHASRTLVSSLREAYMDGTGYAMRLPK